MDIGCCRGEFVQLALARGYDAYGLDSVPIFVEYARQNIGEGRFAISGADLKSGVRNLPTQRFSVVTMWDVIEHLGDPVGFCAQIAEILESDGLLFLRTPNRTGQLLKEKILRPIFGDGRPYLNAIEHVQVFGPRSIDLLARRTGFRVISCEPSAVESYGDRGAWFDLLKRFAYGPLVHSLYWLTGKNIAHSMNCALALQPICTSHQSMDK